MKWQLNGGKLGAFFKQGMQDLVMIVKAARKDTWEMNAEANLAGAGLARV